MKKVLMKDKKHDLISPIASMIAQIELLKLSHEYNTLPEPTKKSIERLNQKLLTLNIRLKAFLKEIED